MATWRYDISLVLKKYFTCSLRSLVKYFSTLEEKFPISARPSYPLYIYCSRLHLCINLFNHGLTGWLTNTLKVG